MNFRDFGATGMKVSEVGFGAWAIGGQSYGAVDRAESLRALARAEELGCNFVDTAAVYGNSEEVLGEFLRGRRDKWLVATKFSNQDGGLLKTAEEQLKRLGVETIDFYQLHWVPAEHERHFIDELYSLKRSGKARFIGVSLKTAKSIDYVLDHTEIDGFQIPFSLLDPEPYLSRLARIREKNVGIIVRSSLKQGFLTRKYTRESVFPDASDQRHEWSREQIARTVDSVETFRFLEEDAGSLAVAAARYPLAFPETSTVILGTKTASQADENFGIVPDGTLSEANLRRIREIQEKLKPDSDGLLGRIRRKLRSLRG